MIIKGLIKLQTVQLRLRKAKVYKKIWPFLPYLSRTVICRHCNRVSMWSDFLNSQDACSILLTSLHCQLTEWTNWWTTLTNTDTSDQCSLDQQSRKTELLNGQISAYSPNGPNQFSSRSLLPQPTTKDTEQIGLNNLVVAYWNKKTFQ